MRTRNVIERLAAVAPPEPLLDSGDEDRILQRILGFGRPTVRRGHRATAFVLVGAVLVAAVVAVALFRGHGAPSAVNNAGNHHITLSGAQIEVAGFHFRTPAGFKRASDTSCVEEGSTADGLPVRDGFTTAASADGGCVQAQVEMQPDPSRTIPTPAGKPVDVGSFQGYYDAQGHDVQGDPGAVLYVKLPLRLGDDVPVSAYLVLFDQGLSEDQLIAVAESGLADYHFK